MKGGAWKRHGARRAQAAHEERFLKQGLEGFAPHEVLELLLFYTIPQRNVNPLAHQLLEKFGSLHNVLRAEPRLCQTKGVGSIRHLPELIWPGGPLCAD